MTAVPLFLGGLPIVSYTLLDERQATGGVGEFMRSERFVPAALAICRGPEDGSYLFGCDAQWKSVTDTWHGTLEDVLDQAESEHEGVAKRWVLSAT